MDERCVNLNSKVRFRLGFTCCEPSSTILLPALWVAVESAPNDFRLENLQARIIPSDGASKLRNDLEEISKKYRRVKIELLSTVEPSDSTNVRTEIAVEQKDLDEIENLCNYIRQTSIVSSREPCIGLLGKRKTFKHLVYHTETPPGKYNDTKTLMELLQGAFDERQQYDWVGKLNLARILALSVLRFNSTAWLPKS